MSENLSKEQRIVFEQIIAREASPTDLEASLSRLIDYLYNYHEKPVIVLLDEYDSPVISAFNNDYYNEMVSLMRNWLGASLKHERGEALYRAVVTGILRITKESIFSGLNNLKVCSILSPGAMADKFGFTQQEVEKLLEDFSLTEHLPEVQEWYNGYRFGGVTIYNPWSVLNFISSQPAPIGPQWLNTASNELIHTELANGGLELKRDLEKLLAGEELRYPITENTVFSEVGHNPENIWSFLYFSGYLNAEDPERNIFDQLSYRLSIPNREVGMVYQQFVKRWQNVDLKYVGIDKLLMSLMKEDYLDFEWELNHLFLNLVSFHDTSRYPEAACHCFILGLLANLRIVYQISSNPETGYGRADIIMRSKSPRCPLSFVIEFKVIDDEDAMEKAGIEGLKQIEEKQYGATLLEAGISPKTTRKLAIVVCRNKVRVFV